MFYIKVTMLSVLWLNRNIDSKDAVDVVEIYMLINQGHQLGSHSIGIECILFISIGIQIVCCILSWYPTNVGTQLFLFIFMESTGSKFWQEQSDFIVIKTLLYHSTHFGNIQYLSEIYTVLLDGYWFVLDFLVFFAKLRVS